MLCWNPSKTLRSHLLRAAGGMSPSPPHWSSWLLCCQESGWKLGPWGQGGGRDQVGPPVLQHELGLGVWCGVATCDGEQVHPSPWSLVLLVVGWVWAKDRLFLRDQPFKIHCPLSTQFFLSLRWILGAFKSCFFFLSFKTVNWGITLFFFIFAFWFERNQTIVRWKLLSACLPHHRNEWISYLGSNEFLRILLNLWQGWIVEFGL